MDFSTFSNRKYIDSFMVDFSIAMLVYWRVNQIIHWIQKNPWDSPIPITAKKTPRRLTAIHFTTMKWSKGVKNPIGSMALVYLPTFTINLSQM